jgi:hypothetical protein
MNVVIRGGGVAAHCCARLLRQPDFRLAFDSAVRPKLPAIMIGAATQGLFHDVFGQPNLFDGLPRITKRIVAWGHAAERRVLRHDAVVVDEQALLDRLTLPEASAYDLDPDWTIVASRPLPSPSVEQHFGSRTARAIPVKLLPQSDKSACYVESLDDGWLFLVPDGRGNGWLLAVGDAGHSRLVRAQIAEAYDDGGSGFPAHPRLAWPLCGTDWLACGTGALAFDPLCGDGSGNAIREAILAAAVLRAVARGARADELLQHYRVRLLAGFHRHLTVCEEYYLSGGSTPWWSTQLESVRRGIAWSAGELGHEAPPRYRLQGFDLERVC